MQNKEETGKISDGYHTFDELYEFRLLYNALAFNAMAKQGINVQKSKRHSDGKLCFGGDWFIVIADLPGVGQISSHYREELWDFLQVPSFEVPTIIYDGHTSKDVIERIIKYLGIKQI